jgi:hypothetical protein
MNQRSGHNAVPGTVPPHLRAEERFNPHRDLCGFFAPDIVARRRDISDGVKRLYERAVRWAGRNGRFWYAFETIAHELGKSPRQVKRDMDELEKLRLIEHVRRGRCQSNMYYFLYHSMFASEVTPMSHHPESEVPDTTSEVTSTALHEVTSMSLESCKKNCVKEYSSSENESAGTTGNAKEKSDDDIPLSSNENQTPDFYPQFALMLSGEDSGRSDPLMDIGPLPDWFIDSAAKALHASKCTTLFGTLDLALYPRPDRQITVKIAEFWRGKSTLAFFDWLCSTVERRLGNKGRARAGMVYGLFYRDSEQCAKGWEPGKFTSKTLPDELRREQAAAEHQAEQTRRRLLMETPATLADAVNTLNGEVRGWKENLSERFLWLMQRITPFISPENLLIATKAWRRCTRCGDGGLIGSLLKGTFNYCDCQVGQQERLERGDTYLAQEIGRVNANFRSRIVQACRELKLDFTGDAIAHETTQIVERDGGVQVLPTNEFQFFGDERDLRQALEYMGDTRDVVLIRPAARPSNFKEHGFPRTPVGKAKESAPNSTDQQQTAVSR